MASIVTAFLMTCAISDGASQNCEAYPFPTMDECKAAVEAARFEIATGGDAQASYALFCVPDKRSSWKNGFGYWIDSE